MRVDVNVAWFKAPPVFSSAKLGWYDVNLQDALEFDGGHMYHCYWLNRRKSLAGSRYSTAECVVSDVIENEHILER